MKRPLIKFMVGLFALVGVFFVYMLDQNSSLYKDNEMKAANLSQGEYPSAIGDVAFFGGIKGVVTRIDGDFMHLNTTRGVLMDGSGDFTPNYNTTILPSLELALKDDSCKILKSVYEVLGNKFPDWRTTTYEDFFTYMDLIGLSDLVEGDGTLREQYQGFFEQMETYGLGNKAKTFYLYFKPESQPILAEHGAFLSTTFNRLTGHKGNISNSEIYEFNLTPYATAAQPCIKVELIYTNIGILTSSSMLTTFLLPYEPFKTITEIIYTPNNETHMEGETSSAKGTVLGTITSKPEKPYPKPVYTIDQGSDTFTINENNEVIINIDNITGGTYTFTIKAHQDASQETAEVDLTSQEFTVVIDSPYKQITDLTYNADSGKNPLYLDTNVDVGRLGSVTPVYGTGSDSGYGVRYSLTSTKGTNDNASFSIDNNGILSITSKLTQEKTYTVEVTAQETDNGVDVSGRSYTKVFSFVVGAKPVNPITAITFTPNYVNGKNSWTIGDQGISANGQTTGTLTFSGGSSPTYQKWEIVDAGGNATIDNNFSISGNQLQVKQKLGVGSYTIRVKVTDTQGETYTDSITIVVTQASNIDINDGNKGQFYEFRLGNGSIADITKWQKEDIIIHPKHALYSLMKVDNGTFANGDQRYSKEGTNTVTLQFQNADGGLTNPISETLKIDKTKPRIVSAQYVDENGNAMNEVRGIYQYAGKGSIDIELTAEDLQSGIAKYHLRAVPLKSDGSQDTGKQPVNQSYPSQSTTFTYSLVNSGIYRIEISVEDEAGNLSDIHSKTVMIDNEAPLIDGVSDRSEYKQYYLPRLVSVSDALSGVKEAYYRKDSGTQTMIVGKTKVMGTGSYELYASDQAGNEITIHFTIVPLPDIDDIDGSDESKDIIDQIQKELDEIRDQIDATEEDDYEQWIEDALDKWEAGRKKVVETDDKSAKVEGQGNTSFDPKVELIVDPITEDDVPRLPKKAISVYDVYLQKGQVKVQPDGSIKVYLPYDETEEPIVYEIDGNSVNEIKVVREGNYVTFITDSLMKYAISNITQEDNVCPLEGKEINIDTDKDGYPDLNIDLDGDCVADLSIDMDGDGIPNINIDSNGDGLPDINVDTDEDGVADLNIALNLKTQWKLNVTFVVNGFTYNSMRDIQIDLNEDRDHDGKPDHNIDTDGDGFPNVNVDPDWWEKHGYNQGEVPPHAGAGTGDSSKWQIWWLLMIINGLLMGYALKRKNSDQKMQKDCA